MNAPQACMDPYYQHHVQYYPAPAGPQTTAVPPNYNNMFCYPGSANGWAGIPLISTAQRRPGNNRKFNNAVSRTRSLGTFDEEKSVSTLAMHAHGAPLILRYNRKPGAAKKENPTRVEHPKQSHVTDENHSASTNANLTGAPTETCLPRIIKPRKRRKKDRKPVVSTHAPSPNNTKAQPQSKAPTDIVALNTSSNSSCSCRICDPQGKIWAFPLRRSCSDNSAEIESENRRRKDIGVIGDRGITATQVDPQQKNTWRDAVPESAAERKHSLSDSGDSGCCDQFLSGINLADDLFAASQPTTDNQELCKRFDNDLKLLSSEQLSGTSDCSSVFSDSVASDGVPDLFVNFDSISKNQLFSANNISKLSNLLFDDSFATSQAKEVTAANTNNNNNNNNYQLMNFNHYYNNSSGNNANLVKNSDRPFVFIPDKDRGNEVLNCFDMVWNWNGS